jgi:DNA-binding response OmpR family regulator
MNEAILIVEDEPEFAALVERWIAQAGYRAYIASTRNEALRAFTTVIRTLSSSM